MDITVEHTTIAAMTDADFRKCRVLGMLPDNGCIRYDLRRLHRDRCPKSMAIMAKDPTGRVVSWALIDHQGMVPYVQFWTRTRERRKGYGRLVMARVKQLIGNTFRHFREPDNEGFFRKMQVQRPFATNDH